ncbi:Titin like [Pseudolycoriella hygida]|uniref:Titin like n=1 Tax=Pseudolycoriella hygida TaxID=35572 RepID=A0A9Q0S271_9DIPT|nr:Titin like [Pseudolycoriella hygida]
MGNNSTKLTSNNRPKKNVHWKSAEIPSSPGKPYLVSNIDAPPDVLTLRWDKPRTDGGSPIYGYLVEHRRAGSPHWVRANPSLIPSTELSLSGLEPGWRYQFRVTAENAVGASESSEVSDAVTVTLQRNAVTPPRFVNELHDTVAVENEKVEFRVQVQGTPPPVINWYKDGFEVFSSRRTKIVNENNTSVLIIHQAALTDEGEIKCSATNRAGHVITRAQLKLEAIPKIRLPRQYEEGLLIEADEVVRLKVGIAGRPAPMIVWCHNGEIVKTGGRYEIVSNDKHSSLKITGAKRSDRGEYNLRAINKLGEDNVSFLVTVTDKPSPPGKVMLSMSIGRSASLQWTAPEDDGGCKIGNYIVEYFRVGWNVWLKAATTRQLNATLNDLIEGSEYKFRVKAESPYGMSEPSEESDVLFVPDPKRGINKPLQSATEVSISEPSPTPRRRNPSPSVGERKPIKVDKQEQTTKKVISFDVPPLPAKVKINTQIYDSGAIVREMNYGTSVDEKKNELADEMNRRDENIMKEMTFSGLNETYNPRGKLKESEKPVAAKEPKLKQSEYENFRDGKSNGKTLNMHLSAPQDNPDEVHTSSEFMLVLYDDDKRNNQEKPLSFDLEIDEAISPPPLSLSAPELGTLGTGPPTPPVLRRCVSSTELLYEKAMARFYQAVEFEESESARKRSESVEPVALRTRLSSFGDSDRNSADRHQLERTNSFKRKSTEKVGLGALDKTITKVETFPVLTDVKPSNIDIDDKDKEETEDERDLKKEIMESQRKLHFVQNFATSSSVEYDDDYTESTASSASLSSIDSLEKFKSTLLAMNKPAPNVKPNVDNELNTYHPMMEPQSESSRKVIENPLQTVYDLRLRREEYSTDADVSQSVDDEELSDRAETVVKNYIKPKPEPRALSPYRIPEPDQSTIVLTKPLPAPSADFVPKPILKTSSTESDLKEKPVPKAREKKKDRKGIMQLFGSKKTASTGNLNTSQEKLKVEVAEPKTEKMSAAALAKKKSMEQRQSSIEENKVAVDHYSDIVKEMSVMKKPKVPLYMSAEELKKAAERADDEVDNVRKSSTNDLVTKPKFESERKDSYVKPPVARRSTSRESDSRSIFAIKLSKDTKKSVQHEELIRSQASMEMDSPGQSIPPESLTVSDLDSKTQDLNPISNEESAINPNDEETRGRSSTINKIPTKAAKSRSRSSSTLRNKSVQLKELDNNPPPATRTPSKTRNRSESKSPSVKNRTKLHPTNTLRIARAPKKYLDSKSSTPSASPEPRSQTPEELMVEVEESVKSTMNYVTDLVLFIVACWVYIFKDAWMAVPILSLMVGRQVGSTLKDKFPKWMKRKRD